MDNGVKDQAGTNRVCGKEDEVCGQQFARDIEVDDVAGDAAIGDRGIDRSNEPLKDVDLEQCMLGILRSSADYARKVRLADPVEVDNSELPDTEVGELFHEQGAPAAGANYTYMKLIQAALPFGAEEPYLAIESLRDATIADRLRS